MRTKWLVALTVVPILAIVALIAANGPDGPGTAEGIIPFPTLPPFGVALVVNTPSDLVDPGDGTCSLRAAIYATNINGHAGNCDASASQAGATDGIFFNIGTGTPTINITTALPTITDKLGINGNSGGATRVELHGPGSSTGLDVSGAGAAGTSIRNLVINNFSNGIYLDTDTTKVTIAGNYIGTNAAGTAAVPNATGINGYYHHSQVQIGGLNGLTPGGPCTGDCNLISGNTGDGVFLYEASGDLVEGNFIGTNAAGTAALGNGGDGISDWECTSVTIGGTASGAGNLISGNKNGIEVWASQPVIKGNFIGSDVSGTGAIPNTSNGIYVHDDMGGSQSPEPFTIGGTEPGAGNLISGNGGPGVLLKQADQITLYGNSIGTRLDATTPLSNSGAGVQLALSSRSNVIGGVQAGQANVIAHNGAAGVEVGMNDYYNQIRGDSIHDNTGKGIQLDDQQMGLAQEPPVITGANPVAGTSGCPNCTIDVYSDNAGQGQVYEGSTTADGAGNWTFAAGERPQCNRHLGGGFPQQPQHVRILDAVHPAYADANAFPDAHSYPDPDAHSDGNADPYACLNPNADTDGDADKSSFANGSAQRFSSV
jgi:Right handed beta helix region